MKGVVRWCDGAGLTFSAGGPIDLDNSKARAYHTCSRCRWGLFGHFFSCLSFYAPPQKVAGYYVIPSELLSVCPSVRPSISG